MFGQRHSGLLKWTFKLVIIFSVCVCFTEALLEGIYCGRDNCYDVLGVTRDTSRSEISKRYRQLAKKYHPDLHRTPEAKAEAETQFKIVATAYEILKDEESRNDYDYMLDNPEDYYRHYYRYYRHRVAPKVDVRIVVVVTITIISVIQYYSAHQRYETAITYFMQQPKYRNRALDLAKDQGMFGTSNKKNEKRKTKQETKEETERVIRQVLEENMDIRGGYAKPKITDILWLQLFIFPYTLALYIAWYAKWIWKYTINREPYDEEAKLHIIRKFLKVSQNQFNALTDAERKEFLRKELWIEEKFKAYRLAEEDELKRQRAESAKHKAFRRYLKVHGEGRITFDDS